MARAEWEGTGSGVPRVSGLGGSREHFRFHAEGGREATWGLDIVCPLCGEWTPGGQEGQQGRHLGSYVIIMQRGSSGRGPQGSGT